MPPGLDPEPLSRGRRAQLLFVHIDVDLYEPTRDSIEFFYPRLAPGAVVLCDDFGMPTCPGATKAIEEFLRDKPEKMLFLPDSGGFFIKGVATADNYH